VANRYLLIVKKFRGESFIFHGVIKKAASKYIYISFCIN